MGFTEGMARGYAVGSDIRKRRAASKFFKKVKELTADMDAEEAPTELSVEDEEAQTRKDDVMGALPVKPMSGASEMAGPSTASADSGLKNVEVGAASSAGFSSQPEQAIDVTGGGSGMPPPDLAAPAALPVPTASERRAAASAAPESALPVSSAGSAAAGGAPVVDAPPDVQVKGPGKLPLTNAGRALQKSLTQDHIKELDTLAMDAAKAAGDIQVYEALKQTTSSFLQQKVLNNLSLAQQAAVAGGDPQAVENYLTKAYRFIPDGQDVKFGKNEQGQLTVNDPWDENNGKVPVTPELIGAFKTMVMDPERFSGMVYQRKKDKAAEEAAKAEADRRERETVATEKRAETDAAAERRQAGAQKYVNLERMANAAKSYSDAWAKAAEAEGKMKPDDARQYSVAVSQAVDNVIAPKTTRPGASPLMPPQVVTGPPPKGYEMFVDPKTGSPTELALAARDIAGALGIANPSLGVDAAANAGLAIVRAMQPGGPKIQVEGTTIYVPLQDGRIKPVEAPPELIQALAAAANPESEPMRLK
jgi:hypothetical protein